MHEWQSLSHVRWECKYHAVIIPKYRRKVLDGRLSLTTAPTGATSRRRLPGGPSRPRPLAVVGYCVIKPTASGRATRRASSDPACIPSRKWHKLLRPRTPVGQEEGAYARMAEPVPCEVGVQVPRDDHTQEPLESLGRKAGSGPQPPTGATSRRRPPRGGLPNATAFGRGRLLCFGLDVSHARA